MDTAVVDLAVQNELSFLINLMLKKINKKAKVVEVMQSLL